jgi:MOSC domain-containing protein YiiM
MLQVLDRTPADRYRRSVPGLIHQINVSDGGVPKLPVETVFVNVRGALGDRQADRRHHGRPEQALCLYSLEVIEALQAEGHPIEPGSVGENLTISGIDWSTISGGQRLRIGDSVEVQVTFPATPCGKNARWFTDRDYDRIDHDLHPGWSRWYARVVAAGPVTVGDSVEVVGRPTSLV